MTISFHLTVGFTPEVYRFLEKMMATADELVDLLTEDTALLKTFVTDRQTAFDALAAKEVELQATITDLTAKLASNSLTAEHLTALAADVADLKSILPPAPVPVDPNPNPNPTPEPLPGP